MASVTRKLTSKTDGNVSDIRLHGRDHCGGESQ